MSTDYEAIRLENIERYGKDSDHLFLIADLYSTRTHFIYEILQNSEDALSCRTEGGTAGYVHFHLHSDRLEIRHNGKPFTEKNVIGVCGVGKSTKKGDCNQIGKLGIGFKSVYAYTFFPQIHSGREHFEIQRFVEPHELPSVEDLDTLIIIPFDQPDKRPVWAFKEGEPVVREDVLTADAVCEIGSALRTLGLRTMLFLQHIEEIKWTLPDNTTGHFIRNTKQIPYRDGLRKVEVLDQNNHFERWWIFSRDVEVQDAGKLCLVAVEIAYLIKDGSVTRAEDTKLVVFFPTDRTTELGFLIQAPFKTTKARDNIKTDVTANHQMLETAAQLAADSLLVLRDLGLLNVASYAALPLRAQDFPESSLFRPVYDKVCEALKTLPLLPANGGGFIKADQAKLARGKDLVTLFSPEQLSSLFGKERLVWLDASITESGETADLHTYLIGRKKQYSQVWEVAPIVEGMQVDADILAPKLTADFLGKQPIDWVARFIPYAMQGAQSLRKVPFIRLESGGHVSMPSDKLAQPAAWFAPLDNAGLDLSVFPLVFPELAANEQIRKLLGKEGIREIDAAAIVGKCILPLYQGEDRAFDEAVYRDHLRQIRKAYTEANDAAKKQLTTNLDGAEWLACIHASGNAQDKIIWKKPGASDVFARTSEHEIWFHGLETVGAYFLHPSVNNELDGIVIIVIKPASAITQKLHSNEYPVTLKSTWGDNIRGVDGFKPDATVVGLQSALDNWNKERAITLWKIMLSAPRIISGETQSSSNINKLDAAKRNLEYTEVGKLCRDRAWLPNKTGDWCKPGEIFLTDLLDVLNISPVSAKVVADKLGMKQHVSSETIVALGFSSEDEMRRAQAIVQSPDELREFEEFKQRNQREAQPKPALPEKTSPNPERRAEKITNEVHNTPAKTTEVRARSVNPDYPEAQGDARSYLEHQYTNEDGVMFCQICQEPQPVLINGNPHFEAVDCVKGLNAHHEQNNLALCPNHAAMYSKCGLNPDTVQRAVSECEGQKIPLNLAGNEVELYFTQQHLGDLRAVLNARDSMEDEL